MIIQVAGLVLVTASILAGAWYATEIHRTKIIAQNQERMQRAEHAQRIFENNAMMLYEDERQRRQAAETKVGILQHQLKRAREQMAKVTIGK